MDAAAVDRPKLLCPVPGCFVRQEVDNISWVDMGPYLLVIDALERPELTREVLAAIEHTAPGKPIRAVINTHTHHDHVALNEVFRRRFGAQIVNAETHVIPPAGLTWTEGARRLEVHAAPGCHTDEDLFVWLPAERLLFVGDIFGWGLIPWDHCLDRTRFSLIVSTYCRLAELEPAVVVPGHGPLCTAAELRRWVEYITALLDEVRRLCHEDSAGRLVDTGSLAPPDNMRHWWRFAKWKHADSVSKLVHAVTHGRL
jgi:cyclase